MKISSSLQKTLIIGLITPMSLFILGAYNGVMQTFYRAGVINNSQTAGINYYQGLTMHGVINAIVLTTFFAVVFGHVVIVHYFKKEPNKLLHGLSMGLMLTGTLMDSFAMITGKAQALYTFYAPLQASPLFYIGTSLLIVGSWLAYFSWLQLWNDWRKTNPDQKIPVAVLGTLVNFTMWFLSSIPVAYETLVILTPWSLGWVKEINIPLTRMLFWMFGHPLVYFWLLPAYVAYYSILPKVAGGKLYSGNAGRLAFLLFLILSTPVGVHHQFSEPALESGTKLWVSILTYGVSIPSFMTAFTVGASLEFAGRKNGAKGWLDWLFRLPYFQSKNYMFGYFICGLILFIFGGLSGIVNASYSLNQMVHNTGWVPGHFHMTVAGPVLLVILGVSLHIISTVTGKPIRVKNLATIVPYIWAVGVALLSHGLMSGGLMGEPRRSNLGMTYTNPESPLFNKYWLTTTHVTMFGGILMGTAALIYFYVFFHVLSGKRIHEPAVLLPESEELHQEKQVYLLNDFRPWAILSILLVLSTYIPSLQAVLKYGKSVPNRFEFDNSQNLNGNK